MHILQKSMPSITLCFGKKQIAMMLANREEGKPLLTPLSSFWIWANSFVLWLYNQSLSSSIQETDFTLKTLKGFARKATVHGDFLVFFMLFMCLCISLIYTSLHVYLIEFRLAYLLVNFLIG